MFAFRIMRASGVAGAWLGLAASMLACATTPEQRAADRGVADDEPATAKDAAIAVDAPTARAEAAPPDADREDASSPRSPDVTQDSRPGRGTAAGEAGLADAAHAGTSPLVAIGPVELVQSGYQWLEGARWVPALGKTLISDVYGNAIYQVSITDQIQVFRQPSSQANNLDLDRDGHLMAVEINRRVSRTRDDGSVVDAVTDYAGLKIRGPNDLVVLADGTIYVTDTAQNRILRIDPAGVLSYAVDSGDLGSNGLALSSDEKTLYVSYPNVALVRAFTVAAPDHLVNMRDFAKTAPVPDGLCVDQEGNVYAGTQAGIHVFDPAGRAWGVIALPAAGNRATNCAFAGADARTLYALTPAKLYRVRMARPGVY